jgi:hypothetical protein
MRVRAAVGGAMAVLGVGAALAVAQTPGSEPTVTINAGIGTVAVATPGPVAAGPTQLTVTRAGGTSPVSVYVVLPVPGVTQPQIDAVLTRSDKTGDSRILGLVSVQAGFDIAKGETSRTVGLTLKPGLSYMVIAEYTKAGGKILRSYTTLTTSGASNGATAPAADATIRLEGLRFRGDAVLPRRGLVRVQNYDGTNHIGVAFPLRTGVSSAKALAAVRSGSDAAFGAIIGGAPYDLQNILSGGDTSNDHQVRFPKSGKYLLMCFIDQHEKLGMYRVVTVR